MVESSNNRVEQVRTTIEVPPMEVYEAVSDVRRMGEWSPEATGAELLTGEPIEVGSRFRGTNANKAAKWSTTCTVTAADPGNSFAFEVRAMGGPISRWQYDFREVPEGTEVIETWVDLRSGVHGAVLSLIGAAILRSTNRHEHNRRNMETTLQRLRASLEGNQAAEA